MAKRYVGTTEALEIAEGVLPNRDAIVSAGLRRGFAEKAPDGHHYIFNRAKLLGYLKKIREGFTRAEITEILGVKPWRAYALIREKNIRPITKLRGQFIYGAKDVDRLIAASKGDRLGKKKAGRKKVRT
jgi:hypothetical protein